MVNELSEHRADSDLLLDVVGSTAIVKLNRPEVRNALRQNTWNELQRALDHYTRERRVRAIIITGVGDAFSSGADLREMLGFRPRDALKYVRAAHGVLNQIETSPKPVIAAVNGPAIGAGCDLSLACDLTYASTRAIFGWTGVNLGLVTALGGNGRAFSILGSKKAKELFLMGKLITAQEARDLGLVNEVTLEDTLLTRCLEVAEALSHKAPTSVAMVKRLFNTAANLKRADSLEARYFVACYRTADTREGILAYIEKRQPVFKGR